MAKRVDANQRAIVAALRSVGASVQDLSQVGQGVPDLLICYGGTLRLIEIKTARGKLTPRESAWIACWKGSVSIVHSVTEALAVLGIVVEVGPLTGPDPVLTSGLSTRRPPVNRGGGRARR